MEVASRVGSSSTIDVRSISLMEVGPVPVCAHTDLKRKLKHQFYESGLFLDFSFEWESGWVRQDKTVLLCDKSGSCEMFTSKTIYTGRRWNCADGNLHIADQRSERNLRQL